MAKLHMRLSVEFDISDKLMTEIVDDALLPDGQLSELVPDELPELLKQAIQIGNFKPCDWDDGGYIPESWLAYDAVGSGLYEASEFGVKRKENTK